MKQLSFPRKAPSVTKQKQQRKINFTHNICSFLLINFISIEHLYLQMVQKIKLLYIYVCVCYIKIKREGFLILKIRQA